MFFISVIVIVVIVVNATLVRDVMGRDADQMKYIWTTGSWSGCRRAGGCGASSLSLNDVSKDVTSDQHHTEDRQITDNDFETRSVVCASVKYDDISHHNDKTNNNNKNNSNNNINYNMKDDNRNNNELLLLFSHHDQQMPTQQPNVRYDVVTESRCDASVKPATSRRCQPKVCSHHRHTHAWVVGDWSECRPMTSRESRHDDVMNDESCTGGADAVPGIQSRDVMCVAVCGRGDEKGGGEVGGGGGKGGSATKTNSLLRIGSHLSPNNHPIPLPEEEGAQRRSSSRITEEFCRRFSPAPQAQRACVVTSCPRDCVTSDFGPLSGCETCWTSARVRYRTVLLAPTRGGRPCTDLLETTVCPSSLGTGGSRAECEEYRHTNYKYRVGSWTDCSSFHGGKGGGSGVGGVQGRGYGSVIGQRRRQVECIDVKGNTVDRSFCSHTRRPYTGELCVLTPLRNCPDHIVTTPTPYSQSYYSALSNGFRRDRSSSPKVDCDQETTTETIETKQQQQTCNNYKWLFGLWNVCEMQQTTDECGAGIQNRTVICVTATGLVPVSDQLCQSADPPAHVRLCEITCPQDCIVSAWSTWSECLPDRCRLEKNKSKDGYRMRSRTVLRANAEERGVVAAGGAPCPHLHETQPCDYPPCYSWRLAPPGDCRLSYPDMQCGQGLRNRTAECVSILGGVVSSRLCYDRKPSTQEDCYLPCSNDCITTEWSEWSQCQRSCSSGRAIGQRTRYRDILANPGLDGTPCPPVRLLIDKERCTESICHTFYWQTGLWGQCQFMNNTRGAGSQCATGSQCSSTTVDSSSSTSQQRCGIGTRRRDVYCQKSNGERQPAKKCLNEVAPPSVENCTISCPVDCVVSEFTDWSECPVSCISDDTEFLPVQERQRFILAPPSTSGGLPCPPLRVTRPCMNLARCVTYRWQTTEWSPCLFYSQTDKCGSGYRAREVRCVTDKDEYPPEETCQSELGPSPSSTQPCRVDCDQETCTVSDWSEWSPCSKRCAGFQTRIRTMEGASSRVADCYDRGRYPMEEERACPCPRLTAHLVGLWSDCIIDPDLRDPDLHQHLHNESIGQMKVGRGYCGVGRRSHALACSTSPAPHDWNISARVCGANEFMDEMCFIPCPSDCQLSPWTDWSTCKTDDRCGNGLQTRSRYVIEPSLDGGRDCPSINDGGEEVQIIPCHSSCDEYHWSTEEWSSCTPTAAVPNAPASDCGPGLQSRIVRCMRTVGEEEEEEEEDDYMCDRATKPYEINYCLLPCPGQCVVSSWTSWSNCTEGCAGNERRRRTRTVVRHPAPLGSTTTSLCPHLEEFERCDTGLSCLSHVWHWSNWSVCLPHGKRVCGAGRRIRFAECVRGDGAITSRDFCIKKFGVLKEVNEEMCTVPCPVDCVVSDWSPWSECSQSCQLGVRTRTRDVIIASCHRGRHCPEPLRQHKYCEYKECFYWSISDWSACKLDMSTLCGYGAQTRNLSCLRLDDGLQVDSALCAYSILDRVQLIRECVVPCPDDCRVSEWSVWGPCHRPCNTENNNIDGVQTRSRAILSPAKLPGGISCPAMLVETRPCSSGPTSYCPTYSWHTSSWLDDARQVWCQRSDGLIVYGACSERDRPMPVRNCHPECVGHRMVCVNGDTCTCERGYEPIFLAGRLTRCERIQANRSLQTVDDGSNTELIYYVVFGAASVIIAIILIVAIVICRSARNNRSHSDRLVDTPGPRGLRDSEYEKSHLLIRKEPTRNNGFTAVPSHTAPHENFPPTDQQFGIPTKIIDISDCNYGHKSLDLLGTSPRDPIYNGRDNGYKTLPYSQRQRGSGGDADYFDSAADKMCKNNSAGEFVSSNSCGRCANNTNSASAKDLSSASNFEGSTNSECYNCMEKVGACRGAYIARVMDSTHNAMSSSYHETVSVGHRCPSICGVSSSNLSHMSRDDLGES